MHKKRTPILLAGILLLALTSLGIYASASRDRTDAYVQGNTFSEASNYTSDPVVAAYNGSLIKQSVVDYEKQNMTLLASGEAVSDEQALSRLLLNLIMLDEAERLGISVTQEEVEYALTTQLKNYQQYEDAQAIVDDFCAGAGITTEAYFSIVEEQLPRVILRQKLRDALGKEYCDQHGLTFTKVNPPQEMQEYVENYLNSLLETYSADITYYTAAE